MLAGIRRTKGMAPTQKSPLLTDDVLALVATCDPGTLAGARDRALLLVGYMGAFRRSELASLDVGDLERQGLDGVEAREPRRNHQFRGIEREAPRLELDRGMDLGL